MIKSEVFSTKHNIYGEISTFKKKKSSLLLYLLDTEKNPIF